MKNGWHIGLVENEQKYRDFVREIIEKDSAVASFAAWNSAEEFWRDEMGAELDLIFIDIQLSHMNGVELTRLINERNPDVAKVILTNMNSEDLIFKALKYGAVGYVLKSELEDIGQVLRTVMGGGAIITPTIALQVMNSFSEPSRDGYPTLTVRETQVLEQLIRGLTKKKAAERLGISEDTLRWHAKNIYKKLNVTSKLELLKKSDELGLG